MARQCHLNTCPTGIATQKPELRAKFRGKPEHIVTLFRELSADLQRLLAKFGLRSLEDAIGRVDLLEQVRSDGGLNLKPMLADVGAGPRRWMGERNDRPGEDERLDAPWTADALEAARRGEKYTVSSPDLECAPGRRRRDFRSAGRCSGEGRGRKVRISLSRWRVLPGSRLERSWLEGVQLVLKGQANDFVGKGLSGGELVLQPVGRAAHASHEHVILGNVALYGATAGRLFAAGRAGERFAVRNSGAVAVVEGIGDHGCEYMTGGTVVILGAIGMNFGAGMTGGTAWVLDEDETVLGEQRYHAEFLEARRFGDCSAEEQSTLFGLLQEHVRLTGSELTGRMLADWAESAQQFVLFVPKPQA